MKPKEKTIGQKIIEEIRRNDPKRYKKMKTVKVKSDPKLSADVSAFLEKKWKAQAEAMKKFEKMRFKSAVA